MDEENITLHKLISAIGFDMLSPTVIQQMSAVKVVTAELYDKEGFPVDGGLMDTRMGVIDPSLRCKTCGGRLKECFGHFGYIALARPVVHVIFAPMIYDILRCTCKSCGKLLIPDDKKKLLLSEIKDLEEESTKRARLSLIAEIVSKMKNSKKCPHCKSNQGKITIEKPTTFLEDEKRLTPIEVRTRLEKINDEDLKIFGMNPKSARPEWMVLTVFPVAPVSIRPSITLQSGERSEDDLTHKLGDIVRINQRLFENINAGAPEIIIEDLWDLLQYHISTYFDNSLTQIPPARHRSGQPLTTISERIESKEGRIRHNLAGKRTNFSSRTVISPDPMLKLNEVGVPKIIAMKLTVPEKVTDWNKDYLKAFVDKGPKEYPGANYVIRPDGRKKKITDETREQLLEELQPGYVVERHLIDGDIALFNRQPSLHRMSMMAHKVRVLPYRTFRVNPVVCHPYNADFDGDEMNLHIPQTEEARAEAEILMQVQKQMISPRYGLSVIGILQDGITGNYLLTKFGKFSKREAVALLGSAGLLDFVESIGSKEEYTGKEIFSLIIPKDFQFEGKCKDKEEPKVIIKNGKLTSGVMDKSSLGDESGLLLREINKKYGCEYAIEFLSNTLRLGLASLAKHGFSAYVSDADLPKTAVREIKQEIDRAYQDVELLVEQYNNATLDLLPGRTLEDTLERRILERLNSVRNLMGSIVDKNSIKDTPSLIMARSGARGNMLNLTQITACVGQQALRGKRIQGGFRGRTLSCFKPGDLSPSAHGFIQEGFKEGMKPHEFFFAAMTGRDSLMDTALRTPKSGYLYRRLSNALQDIKSFDDGSVRDASGRVVQFKYGEDGVDVSRSEGGTINVDKIIKEVM
ncbi:MAG TPA: DNA-directed RNA polymerase subunit A' [Candidatus Woesearchaeota archaeon]|nr:DNA-directed RNA polymerase subunit A' [Candidatus Woesearchaeota archaeon]